MDKKLLELGYTEAKKITRHFAKTFYTASLFLSKEKRRASYAIYAICRISDEAVDNPLNYTPAKDLDTVKNNIESAYSPKTSDTPLLLSFQETIQKYKIPKTLFLNLIEGMEMDITKTRYENFNQLYEYCYKAAGVVGLIMLEIFGYADPSAKDYAVKLGIAMQLTNILRDVKEDAQRNRIYLPLDEMKDYGLSVEDIINEGISPKFINFMNKQIARAREYYSLSQTGINLISDKKAAFVTGLMKNMYSQILNEIEENNCDVFSKRAHLNNFKKIYVIFAALINGATHAN